VTLHGTIPLSLSAIFPAYNEQDNIGKTLLSALKIFPEYVKEWEIIVVDDGSKDKTSDVINQYTMRNSNIRKITHPTNRGYGNALVSGIQAAKHDLIFFMDADLQFDLNEIATFLFWIDKYDLVIGYRAQRRDPFYRRLNAWGWNTLGRLLLNLPVRDIDCAFKLFRRTVFETVSIESVGAMVNTEILAQACRHGFRIKELPVTHYPRVHGEQSGANLTVIVKAFRELIKLYHKLK
jgi:glycosyltransferase involved in cell wall biosynthesis